MKQKFEEKRIKQYEYDFEKQGKFPVFHIEPKKPSKDLIFFLCGLDGNGVTITYFNYDVFDNYHLIAIDGRAQASNKSKSSRTYKTYIKDIHNIINKFKEEHEINKVYLIGESWGSALALLYNKTYHDVNGIFIWNMPCKIVNITKVKPSIAFKRNTKMFWTFLTNADIYDERDFDEALTNSKALVRAINVFRNKEASNRVTIAAWRSFSKAWKYVTKNYNDINFHYIQSLEDVMIDKKKVDKLAARTDKVEFFDKGYHILSFDENVEDKLFNTLKKWLGQQAK